MIAMHRHLKRCESCRLCGWTNTIFTQEVSSCVARMRQKVRRELKADAEHVCAGDTQPGGLLRDFFEQSIRTTRNALGAYGGEL